MNVVKLLNVVKYKLCKRDDYEYDKRDGYKKYRGWIYLLVFGCIVMVFFDWNINKYGMGLIDESLIKYFF